MLNSNFNLRSFLAESKAPKEQIQEATLTEATVMEYIRERMTEMNNEVRSCMKEYLQRCNEIDPGHEDAHAQLMGALEDFYNKLKAHFEEDAMDDAGEELATTEPAPSRELDGSPMYEGEEEGEDADGEYGHEEPEDEMLDEGILDTIKDKMVSVGKKLLSKFSPEDQASMKAAAEKVLGPNYSKEDITLDKAKEIGKIISGGLDESQELDENLRKKIGGALVGLGLPTAFVAGHGFGHTDAGAITAGIGIAAAMLGWVMTLDEGQEVEVVNEAIDPETVDLLMGLAKSAVTMGTVPAALAVLYQFKDHPKIAKVVTAFEKHLDK